MDRPFGGLPRARRERDDDGPETAIHGQEPDVTSEAERRFHADLVRDAARLQREIGYNATRFRQMLAEIGGVQTAHRLLSGPSTSDGFTTLWERGRLEMSVEAFVLLPWYAHLFGEEELDTAARRLREHGFDVDRYLRRTSSERPAWVDLDTPPE